MSKYIDVVMSANFPMLLIHKSDSIIELLHHTISELEEIICHLLHLFILHMGKLRHSNVE